MSGRHFACPVTETSVPARAVFLLRGGNCLSERQIASQIGNCSCLETETCVSRRVNCLLGRRNCLAVGGLCLATTSNRLVGGAACVAESERFVVQTQTFVFNTLVSLILRRLWRGVVVAGAASGELLFEVVIDGLRAGPASALFQGCAVHIDRASRRSAIPPAPSVRGYNSLVWQGRSTSRNAGGKGRGSRFRNLRISKSLS